MKSKFKLFIITVLSIAMLGIVGCGTNNDANNSNAEAPSNQQYYDYLTERYNHYFGDAKNKIDVFAEDFTYNDTYDTFITTYNQSYTDLKSNLESFKNDLQNNIAKGNEDVDKYNEKIITSIDKNITEIDKYTSDFSTKTKDYATLAKDEVVKGLRTLGKAPHDARVEFDKLVEDAKNTLGIN